MNNTKERNEEIQGAALRIFKRAPQEDTLTLARKLATKTACHLDTAKRHIRRLKLAEEETPEWGGYREGAGRPPDQARRRKKRAKT